MKFWTQTLTSGSLTINAADGANFLSVVTDTTAGSCTILGGISFKGLASNAVALSLGQGANFSAVNPTSPLDGITITWVAGNIDIIVGF